MNNISTMYSGAVSTETLSGDLKGCKHFVDKKSSIVDNWLRIKTYGEQQKKLLA